MTEKYSGTLKDLRTTDPFTANRIEEHFGPGYDDWTLGEIGHYLDTEDPRSLAANRQRGDFVARGGSGPQRR